MNKSLLILAAAATFFTSVASAPSVAARPEADALAHNAAYESGATIGISPVTLFEMLTCSAMWDRWDYAVSSAADPKFTGSLRRELTSANAKKRKISWRREARRQMDEDDDAAYFESAREEAETDADKVYAAYVNNEERGMTDFISWLGTCQ